MPARALCLRVFVMLVFLAHCRRGYSVAERHCSGESIQRSAYAPTRTPGSVGDGRGVILRVIRAQTLRLSVSCFCLHVPCPERASFFPTPTTCQAYTHTHIHTHIDTHTYTHIRRCTPKDTPKDVSHTHKHTHIHTRQCLTNIYTLTHTNTHKHTHTLTICECL